MARRRWLVVAAVVIVALIVAVAAFLLLRHPKAGAPGILLYGPLDIGAVDRAPTRSAGA